MAHPSGAPIPAKSLRERLPATLATATERQQLVYNEGPDNDTTRLVLQSFSDFVELCECKEREKRASRAALWLATNKKSPALV